MIAFCAAGVVVPRPWMTDFGKMLTYVSDIRYAFQVPTASYSPTFRWSDVLCHQIQSSVSAEG
jgi:hypothetical protein